MANQTEIKSGCYPFALPLQLKPGEKWKPYPIFHGSTVALQDFSCHVSTLVTGFSPHPPHEHKEEEILIVLSGEVDIILKDHNVTAETCFYRKRLQKNQFAYYPSYFAHSLETISEKPANYLMFRWCGSSSSKKNTLDFCFFDSLPPMYEIDSRQAVSMQRIFEEPTSYLKKLHCHKTTLAAGAGYPPHADPYDVAIILLEGEVQTLGQNIKAPGVIFYEAGKPHGMLNPTDHTAQYLVFEFHRHASDLLQEIISIEMNSNIKPSLIMLDASSACQLKCSSCPTGQGMTLKTLGAKYLRFIDFKNLIDANPWIRTIELSNWGEIFLNPEIISILEYGFKKNVALQAYSGVNLNTVSNDILEALVKYQFQGMTVSLDGASNDTYKIYRVGGDFEKVIAHIRTINAFKLRYKTDLPKMTWQFVAFGHNEHEITKARNMAAELKMDFYVKLSFGDLYTGKIFSPIRNRELIRRESGVDCADRQEYFEKYGEYYLQKTTCAQLWKNPHIHADGRLLGCCINYKQDYGNVFEEGLLECINNEKMNYARQMLLGQKPPREDIPCSTCIFYQTMRTNMEHEIIAAANKDAKKYPSECNRKEKALSVAFFSHSADLGGAERSLVDLVEDLCNNSVLCSVLLPSDGPLKDMLLDRGADVYVLPAPLCWWAGDDSSFNEETQKLQLTQSMMVLVTGALPILKQLKPDVVYTQTIVAPWGVLCAEILSIPHVLSVCEYGELDHHFKFYFGFRESIKALYDSSEAIFSVTKSVKNEVFKGISDKDNKIDVVYRSIRLSPNDDLYVTPQSYDYENKSEIKIAIFGTIQKGKGQEDIVRAGIELMKKGRKIKIYIFGYSDPLYLDFIKDLIDASVYKENFIISDFVSDPIKHMKEMDIIVSCSRNEALGRTLFEAVLLDKPIVYSDSGGPKEIFTDQEHGVAYKCADEHSLVEKLLFVMDYPDKTKQRVRTVKEYVLANFGPENYSGKIESRLKQLKGKKIETNRCVQALFGFDLLIDALQGEFERKDAEIVTMRNELSERDQLVKVLTEQVEKMGTVAANHNEQIAGLQFLADEYKEALRTIEEIRDSLSWRITVPMRYISSKIKNIAEVLKLLPSVVRFGGGVFGSARKALRIFSREGLKGVKRRILFVGGNRSDAAGSKIRPDLASPAVDRNDYAEWIRRYDTLTHNDREKIRSTIVNFQKKPLISIIMPVYNPKPEWLIEAIESVCKQIYPHWELCIADDASTDKRIHSILERYAREEKRIKVVFRKKNGHISAASNSALTQVTGEWVALLDHDDILAEHALFWVTDAINQKPYTCLIYSDEDKIDDSGRRFDPYFKCDWNMDLFYSYNLISHLGIYRADLLKKIGGFREGMEGSQDYDLALRCIECIEPEHIRHIPRVLYHWRSHIDSTAKSVHAKSYAITAGQKALNEHFQRQRVNAVAKYDETGYRVSYKLPGSPPLVSLIIPTRNGMKLLQKCVESILKKTTYPNYEILIVDNSSDDPMTLKYFKQLKSNPKICVVRDERPFNFSALNNAAVKLARGEIVGLLNNDLAVISAEWLSEMVSHSIRPGIGAVGARLWYPDETLQHGGVILGIGGVAGHVHCKIPKYHNGYFGRASVVQSFSAVTAACMVVQKVIYEEVGGFNEEDLPIAFNDIDFCLCLINAGYRNVWTPYAELYHHESASRGYENTPEKQTRFAQEVAYMKQRWGDVLRMDPAYSPNLTLDFEDFSFAWPPRIEKL